MARPSSYDLTAPSAPAVAAQYRNDLPFPYRRYANGAGLAQREAGAGARFRAILSMRWRITVGAPSGRRRRRDLRDAGRHFGGRRHPARRLHRAGEQPEGSDGVLEVAGLSGEDKEHERGIVLRAIDKLDRLGEDGVRELLGAGRKDEGGDFTKGAGLSEAQAGTIMGFAGAQSRILLNSPRRTLKEMEADANFDPNLTAGYKLLSQQVAQIEKPGHPRAKPASSVFRKR